MEVNFLDESSFIIHIIGCKGLIITYFRGREGAGALFLFARYGFRRSSCVRFFFHLEPLLSRNFFAKIYKKMARKVSKPSANSLVDG